MEAPDSASDDVELDADPTGELALEDRSPDDPPPGGGSLEVEVAEVSPLLEVDPDDVNADGLDDAAVSDAALEASQGDPRESVDADADGTPDGDELVERFLDGVARNARGESPNLLPALD